MHLECVEIIHECMEALTSDMFNMYDYPPRCLRQLKPVHQLCGNRKHKQSARNTLPANKQAIFIGYNSPVD